MVAAGVIPFVFARTKVKLTEYNKKKCEEIRYTFDRCSSSSPQKSNDFAAHQSTHRWYTTFIFTP